MNIDVMVYVLRYYSMDKIFEKIIHNASTAQITIVFGNYNDKFITFDV